MTRSEIMEAAVDVFGTCERVAVVIGVSRTTVLRIARGQLALRDEHGEKLLAALIDHAGTADKLADALHSEMASRPLSTARPAAARAAFGCER